MVVVRSPRGPGGGGGPSSLGEGTATALYLKTQKTGGNHGKWRDISASAFPVLQRNQRERAFGVLLLLF